MGRFMDSGLALNGYCVATLFTLVALTRCLNQNPKNPDAAQTCFNLEKSGHGLLLLYRFYRQQNRRFIAAGVRPSVVKTESELFFKLLDLFKKGSLFQAQTP